MIGAIVVGNALLGNTQEAKAEAARILGNIVADSR